MNAPQCYVIRTLLLAINIVYCYQKFVYVISYCFRLQETMQMSYYLLNLLLYIYIYIYIYSKETTLDIVSVDYQKTYP